MNVESNVQGAPKLQTTEAIIGRSESVQHGDVHIGGVGRPGDSVAGGQADRVPHVLPSQRPKILLHSDRAATTSFEQGFRITERGGRTVGEVTIFRSTGRPGRGILDYSLDEPDPNDAYAIAAVGAATTRAFAQGYSTLERSVHRDDMAGVLILHANGYQIDTARQGEEITMVIRKPGTPVEDETVLDKADNRGAIVTKLQQTLGDPAITRAARTAALRAGIPELAGAMPGINAQDIVGLFPEIPRDTINRLVKEYTDKGVLTRAKGNDGLWHYYNT